MKKWSTTIHAQSGHTLHVARIAREDLPEHLDSSVDNFDTFYEVRNWDADGVVFFYLGKGYYEAPDEVVGWYRSSGSFWNGFGVTLEDAINGMQSDGWLYA